MCVASCFRTVLAVTALGFMLMKIDCESKILNRLLLSDIISENKSK